MFLSQKKAEKSIKELQNNQAETPNVDGKFDLALSTEGDKAYFIRHIAALANNSPASYLLIGVEDKTWDVKGLVENSPLKNSDGTQQTMNQVLAKRLDPALNIFYRTYEVDGKIIGLVVVQGNKPPYVISVEDPRYGGSKSHGKKNGYIYRGVIYIRQGANSIAANRQSKILQIISGKVDYIGFVSSLIFVTILIGIGIGVGVSVLSFGDPWINALLGGAWGYLIGLILNKRVVESLGSFFDKIKVGRIIKEMAGPVYGAIMGAWIGYRFADIILRGEVTIGHPVVMGLIIAPLVAVIFLITILVTSYVIYKAWTFDK